MKFIDWRNYGASLARVVSCTPALVGICSANIKHWVVNNINANGAGNSPWTTNLAGENLIHFGAS